MLAPTLADMYEEAYTERCELIRLSTALLARLETITTDEFMNGGEKEEREALRNYLKEIAK